MDKLKEYLKIRRDLYLFIGRAFYKEADKEYFNGLKNRISILKTLAQDLDTGSDLVNGAIKVEHFLQSISDESKVIDELACEFAYLFLGVMGALGEPSVPTSESVYFSPKRIAMQDERDEVLKLYYKYEMNVTDDFTEPEDHITAEMGFMGGSIYESLKAVDDNDTGRVKDLFQAQNDFLENHLLRLADKLSSTLRVRAKSIYYQGIADILAGYVNLDAIFVKEFLEEINGDL